jgi:hypothetical protein
MKKVLSILLITVFLTGYDVKAQFFQASLVLDNSVNPAMMKVFIRPNPGGGNITNVLWDRFEFFVRRDNTGDAPVFGDPIANTADFPGLGILKGGFGIPFLNGWAEEPGKTNFYFCSQAQASTTNASRTYNDGVAYEIFRVPITAGNFANLEFVADQVVQDPYYITLSRNTAGIGGEANMTASGSLAPPGTHVFYGGTLLKEGNVFIQRPGLLPVDFLSFYAMKSGNDAKLSWSVAGDETNSHFEVLRSVNGRNFTSVQRVNALGNGSTNNSYEAIDINLSKLNSREVFYQIAQFDKDGTKTLSPVRKLSVDGLGKSVTAFPNPARTSTKVVVDAPEAGKGSLIMRDATGRQVQVMNAQFFKGINQFDMNVANLPSGEYNIQVNGGGLNETIKLTKIN